MSRRETMPSPPDMTIRPSMCDKKKNVILMIYNLMHNPIHNDSLCRSLYLMALCAALALDLATSTTIALQIHQRMILQHAYIAGDFAR